MNHTEIGPITDAITSVKRGRLPRSLRVLFHRPKDVHQVAWRGVHCIRAIPSIQYRF